MKDNNDSFLNQMYLISDQAAIQQENDCQEIIENIEIKLKEHVSHLDSVIEIINDRENLADEIFKNS